VNSKERIFRVIEHRSADRIACFCANSTATYEQMDTVKAFWPEGHEKGETMARLALAAHNVIGFDAVRVPFCQTFEAVALGCKYKPGRGIKGLEGIPGIEEPPPYDLEDTPNFPDDFLARGRIPELLKAVRILKKEVGDEVAIVAGIIGPLTITGALVGMVPMLKATFKRPEKLTPFLEVAEQAGTTLANALIEEGADIIACEDMNASPDVIAPHTYKDIELAYQQRQFAAIQVPKILHICGNVDPIVEWMGLTGADILSVDPKLNTGLAREKCGQKIILMGGIDTARTLFMEKPKTVRQHCKAAVADGIQILAPGCTIPPETPTENLLAMIDAAKAHS
jgi:[methyl-Co(III) methanol-specific corrinoid protein]:coenzyme M methyltransferase